MPETGASVWVTGVGATSPYGAGAHALWRGLMSGEHAIRKVELFDTTGHRTDIAAEAPADDPGGREGRTDALAMSAAVEAVTAAGLDRDALEGAGVFWGTSTGGMFEGEEFYWRDSGARRGRVPVARLYAQHQGAPAMSVARRLGATGPVETLSSACSASTMAIEAALLALRSGEVDLAVAGGSDGLCQLTYGGFNALRAVSGEPARPFRPGREGLSIGEGSGALVLMTESSARARGAAPLAVLEGAWSSCDAHHMTAPHPEGDGAARAIAGALEDAGREPASVALLNAHGTGTPHNDGAEYRGWKAALGGSAEAPLVAWKGAIGHTLGACGALEAVASVLAIRNRVAPPTPGAGPVDPDAPADLVLDEPRELSDGVVVSVNLAFGGANAAVVIAPAP